MRKRRKSDRNKSKSRSSSSSEKKIFFAIAIVSFICLVTTLVLQNQYHTFNDVFPNTVKDNLSSFKLRRPRAAAISNKNSRNVQHSTNNITSQSSSSSVLNGLSILVAVASYDFSQIPHLEEVLGSYLDICEAGAYVNLVIHTTSPYPVALIDLLNSRLKCVNPNGFKITISIHSPSLMLHLVDLHRELFYDNIDDYDLFVYTEDDIRVTPGTLAAYLYETEKVKGIVGEERASDFNVGIVRYEYNYPPDVVIDDKTRHATANVTRVYWEHPWKPIFPKVAERIISSEKLLEKDYFTMRNHHQGMYIATRHLLKEWKVRPNCNFHIASNRPGMKNNPSQPAMGTQRVWMSSQMLYSKRGCDVRQVLPVRRFGSLTVHHLPNKNYRRVGKKGRLGGDGGAPENQFGDGTETFQGPSSLLTTEMEFHFALAREFPRRYDGGYSGIEMVAEVEPGAKMEHYMLVEKRMRDFNQYVSRGGVLAESDMEEFLKTGLSS